MSFFSNLLLNIFEVFKLKEFYRLAAFEKRLSKHFRLYIYIHICVCSSICARICRLFQFKDKVSLVADDQSDAHTVSFWISLFVAAAPTPDSRGFVAVTNDASSFPAIWIRRTFVHRYVMNPVYPHAHTVYWHFSIICDL